MTKMLLNFVLSQPNLNFYRLALKLMFPCQGEVSKKLVIVLFSFSFCGNFTLRFVGHTPVSVSPGSDFWQLLGMPLSLIVKRTIRSVFIVP